MAIVRCRTRCTIIPKNTPSVRTNQQRAALAPRSIDASRTPQCAVCRSTLTSENKSEKDPARCTICHQYKDRRYRICVDCKILKLHAHCGRCFACYGNLKQRQSSTAKSSLASVPLRPENTSANAETSTATPETHHPKQPAVQTSSLQKPPPQAKPTHLRTPVTSTTDSARVETPSSASNRLRPKLTCKSCRKPCNADSFSKEDRAMCSDCFKATSDKSTNEQDHERPFKRRQPAPSASPVAKRTRGALLAKRQDVQGTAPPVSSEESGAPIEAIRQQQTHKRSMTPTKEQISLSVASSNDAVLCQFCTVPCDQRNRSEENPAICAKCFEENPTRIRKCNECGLRSKLYYRGKCRSCFDRVYRADSVKPPTSRQTPSTKVRPPTSKSSSTPAACASIDTAASEQANPYLAALLEGLRQTVAFAHKSDIQELCRVCESPICAPNTWHKPGLLCKECVDEMRKLNYMCSECDFIGVLFAAPRCENCAHRDARQKKRTRFLQKIIEVQTAAAKRGVVPSPVFGLDPALFGGRKNATILPKAEPRIKQESDEEDIVFIG